MCSIPALIAFIAFRPKIKKEIKSIKTHRTQKKKKYNERKFEIVIAFSKETRSKMIRHQNLILSIQIFTNFINFASFYIALSSFLRSALVNKRSM